MPDPAAGVYKIGSQVHHNLDDVLEQVKLTPWIKDVLRQGKTVAQIQKMTQEQLRDDFVPDKTRLFPKGTILHTLTIEQMVMFKRSVKRVQGPGKSASSTVNHADVRDLLFRYLPLEAATVLKCLDGFMGEKSSPVGNFIKQRAAEVAGMDEFKGMSHMSGRKILGTNSAKEQTKRDNTHMRYAAFDEEKKERRLARKREQGQKNKAAKRLQGIPDAIAFCLEIMDTKIITTSGESDRFASNIFYNTTIGASRLTLNAVALNPDANHDGHVFCVRISYCSSGAFKSYGGLSTLGGMWDYERELGNIFFSSNRPFVRQAEEATVEDLLELCHVEVVCVERAWWAKRVEKKLHELLARTCPDSRLGECTLDKGSYSSLGFSPAEMKGTERFATVAVALVPVSATERVQVAKNGATMITSITVGTRHETFSKIEVVHHPPIKVIQDLRLDALPDLVLERDAHQKLSQVLKETQVTLFDPLNDAQETLTAEKLISDCLAGIDLASLGASFSALDLEYPYQGPERKHPDRPPKTRTAEWEGCAPVIRQPPEASTRPPILQKPGVKDKDPNKRMWDLKELFEWLGGRIVILFRGLPADTRAVENALHDRLMSLDYGVMLNRGHSAETSMSKLVSDEKEAYVLLLYIPIREIRYHDEEGRISQCAIKEIVYKGTKKHQDVVSNVCHGF
mmetsp:Transcript_40615/g.101595  ORF Transcript_40615/g.101595 Transcript_40615/m.101595 type:complete len:681 (-) Transcript_40615:77-2119(-)